MAARHHRGFKGISHIFFLMTVLSFATSCTALRYGRAMLRRPDNFLPLAADSRIRYEEGAETLAGRAAEYLPGAIAAVEKYHGAPFAEPVEVYICATAESFSQLTGTRGGPKGFVAKNVYLSATLTEQIERTQKILTHELSHYHLKQRIGMMKMVLLPSWFLEGLATLVSEGGGAEFVSEEQAREAIGEGKHLIPENKGSIIDKRHHATADLSPHMYYRQSMMFVNYLKQQNENKFARLMSDILEGERFAQAFQTAYGIDTAEAWGQFKASLL